MPRELEFSQWLELDPMTLTVSEGKHQAFHSKFQSVRDTLDIKDEYNSGLQSSQHFLSRLEKKQLQLSSLHANVNAVLGIFCPLVLMYREEISIVDEIRLYTGLLVDLQRITLSEKKSA